MPWQKKNLGVQQIVELCAVARSTVNYWIRSNKLYAKRSGKNYEVPVAELVRFLKKEGKPVHPDLIAPDEHARSLAVFRHCWDYGEDNGCRECAVYQNQIEVCFFARNSRRLACGQTCEACLYYEEIYLSRLQFIDQIEYPAAVCRELHFMAVNRPLATLCGLRRHELIGAPVDRVFSPESLSRALQVCHQRKMGGTIPASGKMRLKTSGSEIIESTGYFIPLLDPKAAVLTICRPDNPGS
jgi:hypothetical protein